MQVRVARERLQTSIRALPAVMFGVAPPGSVPSLALAVALPAVGEGVEPTVVVGAEAAEVVAGGLATLGALPLV